MNKTRMDKWVYVNLALLLCLSIRGKSEPASMHRLSASFCVVLLGGRLKIHQKSEHRGRRFLREQDFVSAKKSTLAIPTYGNGVFCLSGGILPLKNGFGFASYA